jgi:hypothetical protein
MLYLQGEKVCICGLTEVLSRQITKKIGFTQIANPQSVVFAEGRKLADFHFAELIWGPPSFAYRARERHVLQDTLSSFSVYFHKTIYV